MQTPEIIAISMATLGCLARMFIWFLGSTIHSVVTEHAAQDLHPRLDALEARLVAAETALAAAAGATPTEASAIVSATEALGAIAERALPSLLELTELAPSPLRRTRSVRANASS